MLRHLRRRNISSSPARFSCRKKIYGTKIKILLGCKLNTQISPCVSDFFHGKHKLFMIHHCAIFGKSCRVFTVAPRRTPRPLPCPKLRYSLLLFDYSFLPISSWLTSCHRCTHVCVTSSDIWRFISLIVWVNKVIKAKRPFFRFCRLGISVDLLGHHLSEFLLPKFN